MATLLPDAATAARLAPRPDSIAWRIGSDPRGLAGAGTALLLQVAHPTVAAGVRENSSFQEDPWGRLLRTLDYVYLLTYGGPPTRPASVASSGTCTSRSRASTPAGAATTPSSPRRTRGCTRRSPRPSSPGTDCSSSASTSTRSNASGGWRDLGKLLGIRDRDLPVTWAEFDEYVEETVATHLEDNDVVHDVLDTLARPKAPIGALEGPLWAALRLPAARATRLTTVGLMRPSAREVLGLRWSTRRQRALTAIGAASRATTPLLPGPARVTGPIYLRWRAQAIQTGPFAATA